MNIGYEAKRFFTNLTGLGNYCRFVVDALATHHPQNNYILYTPRVTGYKDVTDITGHPSIDIVTPPSFYRISKSTSLWRTWSVTREESMKKLDIFHGLSQELPISLPRSLKKVVTVHDLIYYRYPEFYDAIDIAIYKKKVKHACAKADTIIAISEQTKADIIHFLGVHEEKIKVIYQGCHPNFHKKLASEEIESIGSKYGLPSSYILNVGTIESRKNAMLIVKALARLSPSDRIPLVIMGRKTAYYKQLVSLIDQLNLSDHVIFLHNIPFDEFPAIYQGATAFVYPSLFEGFGIPLVEAIASGVPVITSTGSCFSEAAGPDSLYVDSHNDEAMAAALSQVIQNDQLRKQMVSSASQYVKRFESKVIADNLVQLYNGLINP